MKNYLLLLALGLFCFILSLNHNPGVAAMAVILIISSSMQDIENKKLLLFSKILAVLITIITVYIAFIK